LSYILRVMAGTPAVAIIGAGRLGSALARELSHAGYSLAEVVARESVASLKKARKIAKPLHARAATIQNARFGAGLLWLCVPDREIAGVAHELAASSRLKGPQWKGKVIFHSSGALASDELNALRRNGAAVASVHPLMTFVDGSIPSLRGVPFAIEGDRAALRLAKKIVKALGGEAFAVRKKDKAAYHAWATFCSPLLIAALVTAEQAGRIAGFSPARAARPGASIQRPDRTGRCSDRAQTPEGIEKQSRSTSSVFGVGAERDVSSSGPQSREAQENASALIIKKLFRLPKSNRIAVRIGEPGENSSRATSPLRVQYCAHALLNDRNRLLRHRAGRLRSRPQSGPAYCSEIGRSPIPSLRRSRYRKGRSCPHQ
jgi:predicted short-subunit dehydrogenase-like oxidoreductase (DUF2520 family)